MQWPERKGPIVGRCSHCGGILRLKWTCRVAKEIWCDTCGTINGRKHTNYDRAEIRSAINVTYVQLCQELGRDTFNLQVFMKLVDRYTLQHCGGRVTTISRDELLSWGYRTFVKGDIEYVVKM